MSHALQALSLASLLGISPLLVSPTETFAQEAIFSDPYDATHALHRGRLLANEAANRPEFLDQQRRKKGQATIPSDTSPAPDNGESPPSHVVLTTQQPPPSSSYFRTYDRTASAVDDAFSDNDLGSDDDQTTTTSNVCAKRRNGFCVVVPNHAKGAIPPVSNPAPTKKEPNASEEQSPTVVVATKPSHIPAPRPWISTPVPQPKAIKPKPTAPMPLPVILPQPIEIAGFVSHRVDNKPILQLIEDDGIPIEVVKEPPPAFAISKEALALLILVVPAVLLATVKSYRKQHLTGHTYQLSAGADEGVQQFEQNTPRMPTVRFRSGMDMGRQFVTS